jgi:hypothetical protein
MDEVRVRDVETPEARIPEVNDDRRSKEDTQHLICNFRASTWSLNLAQL